MISFKEFKKKALVNPKVKKEYKKLKTVFKIKKRLIEQNITHNSPLILIYDFYK